MYCPAESVANGQLSETGQVTAGNSVVVTCNAGFALSGDSTYSCGLDGTWGTKPTCGQGKNCCLGSGVEFVECQ